MFVVILILLALIYLIHEIGSARRPNKRRPPGPWALPLIGNLHQHRTTEPWVQYQAWTQKYGPLVQLQLGLRTVIVLGTRKAVDDILIRRGKRFGSHPKYAFFSDYMANNSFPAHLPDGDHRRAVHRLLTALLTPPACQAYADLLDRESLRLALRLSQAGDKTNFQHIWQYTADVASTLIYGQGVTEDQASEAADVEAIFSSMKDLFTTRNVFLELYPVFNCLPRPFNNWKGAGESYRARFLQVWRRRVQRGLQNANWNWTRLLHDNKPGATSDEQFPFMIAELELAITLSTAVILRMVLAMAVNHSAATQRVRDQITAVVGERTPRLDDQDHFPLVWGFILETIRWHSLMPLSLPYAGSEDAEYMGYQIPAGAMLIVNQWALNMDPDVYTDPEVFRPERWADRHLPEPLIFGFGRRTCPGVLFAKTSLVLTSARLLWAFDISAPEGPRELRPHQQHTALAILAKWPTDQIKMVPRSIQRTEVLEAELHMQESARTDAELLDQAAQQVRLQLATG